MLSMSVTKQKADQTRPEATTENKSGKAEGGVRERLEYFAISHVSAKCPQSHGKCPCQSRKSKEDMGAKECAKYFASDIFSDISRASAT